MDLGIRGTISSFFFFVLFLPPMIDIQRQTESLLHAKYSAVLFKSSNQKPGIVLHVQALVAIYGNGFHS
jgi:hypothetical protein